MNVDKEILNRCIWYEDDEGNVKTFDYVPERYEVRGMTYHTLFPLEITENIYRITEDGQYKHIGNINHIIGKSNEDVIVAMVNSGDYTLSEAIVLWSQSCERCMNVLAYKYLNGKEGYEEYSYEWEKCNTVCKFCDWSEKE